MELHQDAHGRVQMLLLLQSHDPHPSAHFQVPCSFLHRTRQVVGADVATIAGIWGPGAMLEPIALGGEGLVMTWWNGQWKFLWKQRNNDSQRSPKACAETEHTKRRRWAGRSNICREAMHTATSPEQHTSTSSQVPTHVTTTKSTSTHWFSTSHSPKLIQKNHHLQHLQHLQHPPAPSAAELRHPPWFVASLGPRLCAFCGSLRLPRSHAKRRGASGSASRRAGSALAAELRKAWKAQGTRPMAGHPTWD